MRKNLSGCKKWGGRGGYSRQRNSISKAGMYGVCMVRNSIPVKIYTGNSGEEG